MALPISYVITAGNESDIKHAPRLMTSIPDHAIIIGDKGYDSDAFVDSIQHQNGLAVIPPRRTRIIQRTYDRELYRERNRIERYFARLKQFRRLATR
jgi:transposase